jgi:hypothetical protein
MKIYKVERTDKWSYDDYDSFVCVAENEEQARWMVPDDYHERKDDGKIYFKYSDGREEKEPAKFASWAKDLKDIKVTEINPTEPEIILASFNAG